MTNAHKLQSKVEVIRNTAYHILLSQMNLLESLLEPILLNQNLYLPARVQLGFDSEGIFKSSLIACDGEDL